MTQKDLTTHWKILLNSSVDFVFYIPKIVNYLVLNGTFIADCIKHGLPVDSDMNLKYCFDGLDGTLVTDCVKCGLFIREMV